MDSECLDVAIVGTGFGGLAMARTLERAGRHSFALFEKAESVGGTWRDNTYPGAACDVPSHLYSLSDAPRSDWSRLFPRQPEIRRYLEGLAEPFIARGQVVTGFHLERARWDEVAACWQLTAADGRARRAHHLVLALGGLHEPAWPDIPGRESFRGPGFHTARWRHEVDLAGKRVAVIGTGASAVQVVPAIVGRVGQLSVVQRSPAWVMPRPDRPIPGWLRRAFGALPPLRLGLRGLVFGWLELVSSGLLHPRMAFWGRWMARRHLHGQVPDPGLRRQLTPDYPIGCKRVLVSSDYYPALVQPHVDLVDTPVRSIEAEGLRLADGRLLALDAIIYATGFRPLDVLKGLTIIGRDGRRLDADWADRPQAHLGIGVHGYPNLSFVLGPNTALGHNSVLYMIQSQVRHILALIDERERCGAGSAEPTAQAQADFIDQLDRRFRGTAWAGGCRSWYLDRKGRNIALWVGTAMAYRRLTREVRREEYRFS